MNAIEYAISASRSLDQAHAPRLPSNDAEKLAAENFRANLDALAKTQPELAREIPLTALSEMEWTFARDGFLTARHGGNWFTGCSVPLRAAEIMLARIHVTGGSVCFLHPTHAAQIRLALDRIERHQALLVIIPDSRQLAVALRCCDFSADIAAHRLRIAWGERWSARLADTLTAAAGLPLPQQFVKTILLTAAQTDAMVTSAQQVFTQHAQKCAAEVAQLSSRWQPDAANRLCVIAPSQFCLWNDAGAVLADVLSSADQPGLQRFDIDDPLCASGIALARAARLCAAVVAANLSRAQIGAALPSAMPLITWMTVPALPPYRSDNPADALILADAAWQADAVAAGWPSSRIAVGIWPPTSALSPASAAGRNLYVIADTCSVAAPTEPFELSSQQLLWDLIRDELLGDPFVLGPDIAAYLSLRMARLHIGGEGLDHQLFIDRLVLPAYQQGVVRSLIHARLPLRLFGHGWADISEFAPSAGQPVRDRHHLRELAAEAAALVHVWPMRHAHPVDALGRPVLRSAKGGALALIQQARRLLQSPIRQAPQPSNSVLCPQTIRNLLDFRQAS